MKFNLLTALVAGAALAQVGASPIRVVVVTEPHFRFGHAMGNTNDNNPLPSNHHVAMLMRPASPDGAATKVMHKPCRGARMRQKAIEMSNAFRKALGLPLIDTGAHGIGNVVPNVPAHPPADGRVHILPFIGTPPTPFVPESDRIKSYESSPFNPMIAHPRPHHGHHHGHLRLGQRLRNSPFVERLHVALMALGPWEGRAVAFVLGCGIGVLLRMMWVLAIVSYRLVKGPREEEEPRYTEILVVEEYDSDAENVPLAPPTYTYADEKKPLPTDAEVVN
jgi:hypothetical protein